MPDERESRIGKSVLKGVRTNAAEVIKQAMKVRGYTVKMLADRFGYSSHNAITMALSGERNTRIDIVYSFLDELGFDLYVKDRNGSNRDNVWKIERVDRTGGEGSESNAEAETD